MIEIQSCGNRHPSQFLITYKYGNTYKVCKTCFNLPHWNEGIISKEIIN